MWNQKWRWEAVTQRFVWEAVTQLYQLLEYFERTSSPEAPLLPAGKLIWPGDRGKTPQQKDREIKYIPEHMLLQLEQQWLKGDIQKTEVPHHKVPISDGIAA